MAPSPDESGFPPNDEGGGPIKTFLEHLEDLRWVLIKSAAAIAVAMVTCLAAGPLIVDILAWPLRHPLSIFRPKPDQQIVPIHLGSSYVGSVERTNVVLLHGTATNAFRSCSLVLHQIDGQTVFALELDPTNA